MRVYFFLVDFDGSLFLCRRIGDRPGNGIADLHPAVGIHAADLIIRFGKETHARIGHVAMKGRARPCV